jgi:hypothetical protein
MCCDPNQSPAATRRKGPRNLPASDVVLFVWCAGPWMDTNLVTPLTGKDVDTCRVTFDYWLDAYALQQAAASTSSSSSGSSSSSSSSGSGGLYLTAGMSPASAAVVEAALQSKFVRDSLGSSHQVQVRGQHVMKWGCCVLRAHG